MKYVAFLDILGFKNKLRSLNQNDAKKFIGDFSANIYKVFIHRQKAADKINGNIISDSIILYSNDTKEESLEALIELIKDICRSEFTENGIIIRGGIAKGEFDRIPASELPKLQKQLIVGQAYVDAYLLEDSVKFIGVNLSKEVYQDISNSSRIKIDILEEKSEKVINYLFRYIDMDFLLNEKNLHQFILLAKESEWLPHFYNTIYFAMQKEDKNEKVEQLFVNIEKVVCDGNPGENWRALDLFIKNVFSEGVIDRFKVRFLRHIRHKIV